MNILFRMRYHFLQGFFVVFILLSLFVLAVQLKEPSNDRDWIPIHQIMAKARFDGDLIHVDNVRNYTYHSRFDYEPAYYNATYNISKLSSVEFVVEPFGFVAGHTFMSFGFTDGSHVVVSIGTRREKLEYINPLWGLVRDYELAYIVVDEADIMRLHGIYRDNPLFMYPLKISQNKMKALFVVSMGRLDKLARAPEFYNTFFSSCTTNWIYHLRELGISRIPDSYEIFMPVFVDEYFLDLGLISAIGDIETVREEYRIDEKVRMFSDGDFSSYIRERG